AGMTVFLLEDFHNLMQFPLTLGALFVGRHIGLPLRNTLRSDAVGITNPLAGQGAKYNGFPPALPKGSSRNDSGQTHRSAPTKHPAISLGL
ncbi:MAG: hypothetical protein WCW64_09515, partial [Phycisphaerae bacterium]